MFRAFLDPHKYRLLTRGASHPDRVNGALTPSFHPTKERVVVLARLAGLASSRCVPPLLVGSNPSPPSFPNSFFCSFSYNSSFRFRFRPA